jgi:hypothetical protein
MKLLWHLYKRAPFCKHFLFHCEVVRYTDRDRTLVRKERKRWDKENVAISQRKKKKLYTEAAIEREACYGI